MARKSGHVFRGGRMRRETLWIGETETSDVLASANSVVISSSLTTAGLALRPFTIIRTVGYAFITSDQVATSESYQGAFGQCVVSDQAAAIGVTAVPTPFTDLGSDLWFQHQILMNSFVDATTVGFEPVGGVGMAWESRAMRKVNDDQDWILVKEASSLSAGLRLTTAGRSLVKLH